MSSANKNIKREHRSLQHTNKRLDWLNQNVFRVTVFIVHIIYLPILERSESDIKLKLKSEYDLALKTKLFSHIR